MRLSRNNRVVYGNGDLVRSRMLALQIGERELARRTGIGGSAVRSLLQRNEIHTATQLADLQRLMDYLGISPGELLDPSSTEVLDDAAQPDDDVRILAAVLTSSQTQFNMTRLAIAMEWEYDRLQNAIRALDTHLTSLGHRLHRSNSGVAIRHSSSAAERAIERFALLRDDHDGMHQGTARVLYAIYTGTISTRGSRNDHLVQIGTLKNRGVIEFGQGEGDRYALTDAVHFCLDVA